VELVGGPAPADAERAVTAAPLIGAAGERLHPAEVGQAVRVAPLWQAEAGPPVVVHRVAAVVDHRVDRGRAADGLACLLLDRPPVQMRLGPGGVAPLDGPALVGERQRGGHGRDRPPGAAARFYEKYPVRRVLAEPGGDDAPGRSGPDDDVVELRGHGTVPSQVIPCSRSGVPSASRCQPKRVRSMVW
jgi:hypothetical protein